METIDMGRTGKLGVLGLLLTATACGPAQADSGQAEAAASDFARVINVEVATLQPESFVEDVRLTAVAVANQDIRLSAEESGVVRTLYVDRGDVVGPGDWIAKIDDRVLSAQVDQARAAAELASQTWERRKRLWEEDRVGSELAYLEARYAAEQTAATLAGLEERLRRTVVRAPYAGVLEDRYVDVGSMVSPGDAIGRLVDLDPVKVMAGVPERYARDLQVGAIAAMTFGSLGDDVFRAPIRFVGSTIDPENRTFPIEVVVPNANGAIKPQMVADMAVTRREVQDAVVVPQDALVRVEDGYVVFVAAERGEHMVAEARPVRLGPTRRNLVVIEEGVAAGEQLVVVGHKSVADGDRINIVGRGG